MYLLNCIIFLLGVWQNLFLYGILHFSHHYLHHSSGAGGGNLGCTSTAKVPIVSAARLLLRTTPFIGPEKEIRKCRQCIEILKLLGATGWGEASTFLNTPRQHHRCHHFMRFFVKVAPREISVAIKDIIFKPIVLRFLLLVNYWVLQRKIFIFLSCNSTF